MLRGYVRRGTRASAAVAALAVCGAQALLPLQQPWSSLAGWALLAGGVALFVALLPDHPPCDDRPVARRSTAVALCAITLVALALRLVALDRLPLGLWRDEARKGVLALRILHDPTFRPVYVASIADIPALLLYLTVGPVSLFGAHAWTLRLIPALFGALTPLALYFMARPLFGVRVALFAAGLLAVSVWHVSLSRLAFTATLGPPLTLLAIGGLWRALQPAAGRWRIAASLLAGCATGGAVYTYHPSRLTPLVVALIGVVILGKDLRAWRAALPYLALAAVVATLFAWPLVHYAVVDAAGFDRRINQTSIFNPDSLAGRAPAARVEENVRLNLGIWNERGDSIGRHNLPGAPLLDPISGALFALGAGLALAWSGDRRMRLVLVWLGMALIPGVFSIEAPHAVRTVEVIAPTMLLIALGADVLLRSLAGFKGPIWRHQAQWAMIAAASVAVLALNGLRYFVIWPATPKAYEEFYVADTHIGEVTQLLARAPDLSAKGYRIFLPAEPHDDDVLGYLTSGVDVGTFDGQALSQAPGDHALLIVYGDLSAAAAAQARQALGPGGSELGTGPLSPLSGRPEFVIYGRGPEAARAVDQTLASWWGSDR
jgi:4-amino-4-deoxy-L-arabinose transferase-like glycosyltransferase